MVISFNGKISRVSRTCDTAGEPISPILSARETHTNDGTTSGLSMGFALEQANHPNDIHSSSGCQMLEMRFDDLIRVPS